MSSRHQFHLRWSNYGHNLANSFVKLFETESLSDVTLFCEGESYRAHRVVLAASSAHFQELFEQCNSAQNLVVILDGTSAANLRALLEFMYKGEVYIDDANLNSFLQTAKRLQVKGLSLSQNELQSISSDATEDGRPGGSSELVTSTKLPSSAYSAGGPTTTQDNILAQALGPMLIPPQQQNHQQNHQQHQQQQHQQQHRDRDREHLKSNNSAHNNSPPNNSAASFSPPSPARSPANSQNSQNSAAGSGLYIDDKMRKKIRLTSPRHQYSPDGGIPENMVDYHHQSGGPQRQNPQSAILRHLDLESASRQNMSQNFSPFPPHFVSPSSHQQHQQQLHQQQQQQNAPGQTQSGQQQQQQIVITENPNVRKMRSASSENNTMPEDLSIKLEAGREDEVAGLGLASKQRSYSMDLGETPFGPGLPGGHSHGHPGHGPPWSLPSPSSGVGLTLAQQQQLREQQHPQPTSHELNLNNSQMSADGKKLKCPFCDRLYGYETNLRAHIRQRHQGIRVPCPFCTRTFTRNNTVRRHVAREHRALLGGVRAFTHIGPDGPPGPHNSGPPGQGGGPGDRHMGPNLVSGGPHLFGSPPSVDTICTASPSVGSANNSTGSPSQGSPSTNTSSSAGSAPGPSGSSPSTNSSQLPTSQQQQQQLQIQQQIRQHQAGNGGGNGQGGSPPLVGNNNGNNRPNSRSSTAGNKSFD